MWQLPADPSGAAAEQAALLYSTPTEAGWTVRLRFSPDGTRIAAAGNGPIVEIRDAVTGERLLGLRHPAGVADVNFSADGKRLITGGFDGITRIFVLDIEELLALADSRVTRLLTDEECQQYLHLEACAD